MVRQSQVYIHERYRPKSTINEKGLMQLLSQTHILTQTIRTNITSHKYTNSQTQNS